MQEGYLVSVRQEVINNILIMPLTDECFLNTKRQLLIFYYNRFVAMRDLTSILNKLIYACID